MEHDLWQPGAPIGELILVQKLGAGGMGDVFLAQHQTTGTYYAVKTLAAEADDELVARFQREGEAQARVDGHPNVGRVHFAGQGLGRLYLVMDFLRGGDLAQHLEQSGPLGLKDAARLVAQLAQGLEHVHRHGVLHRDLKPANVLFDEEGRAKLVDFGLARVEGQDALTATGSLLGTPSYMAPEQAEGMRGKVDERTDVYGLGAILYHALTGKPPFLGPSTINTLRQVIDAPPVPPSELRPELTVDADRVVLRALAKRRVDRYPTAAALAEDLGRLERGEPIAVASRGGGRVALGVVATLLLLGAGVAAFVRSRGEVEPAPAPVASKTRAPTPAPADDEAPTLQVTWPPDRAVVGETVDVAGRVSEAATIRVAGGGSAEVPAGPFVVRLKLPSRARRLRVSAVDPAGNESRPQERSVLRPSAEDVKSFRELLGPYRVRGHLYKLTKLLQVPRGGRLVIPAGTTLRFVSAAGIRCAGQLWVLGTKRRPVVLEGLRLLGEKAMPYSGWQGIKLEGQGASGHFVHTQLQGHTGSGDCAILARGGASLRMAFCSLRGFRHEQGGAVFVLNLPYPGSQPAQAMFHAVHFQDNRATKGGALKLEGQVAGQVRDCVFRENQTIRDGGAIYVIGAANHERASLLCENVWFEGNRVKQDGGAVALNSACSGTFRNCTFVRNVGGGDAGAIEVDPGDYPPTELTCTSVRFLHNTGRESAGAVELCKGSRATFTGCTFQGNYANLGTAMYVRGPGTTLSLIGNTFVKPADGRGVELYFAKRGITIDRAQLKANGLDSRRYRFEVD